MLIALALGWLLAVAGWACAYLMRRAARQVSRELIADFDSVSQDVPDLRREVEHARRRADEYYKVIDSAVAETGKWRTLYYGNALEHGNAQALMLRQIDVLAQQWQRLHAAVQAARSLEEAHETCAKARISLNPAIQQVANDFRVAHADPARAALAAERAAPPPPAARLGPGPA